MASVSPRGELCTEDGHRDWEGMLAYDAGTLVVAHFSRGRVKAAPVIHAVATTFQLFLICPPLPRLQKLKSD